MKPINAHISKKGDVYLILVFYTYSTLKERFLAWLQKANHVCVEVWEGDQHVWAKVADWPDTQGSVTTRQLNEVLYKHLATGETCIDMQVKGDEVFL